MSIDLSQYKKHEVVSIKDLRVGDIWKKSEGTYYYIVTELPSLTNPQGLMEGYNTATTLTWKGILLSNARTLNGWVSDSNDWVFMRKEVIQKIFVDELE